MPERNTALLERTMQHIIDHPEQHNQGLIVGAEAPCGTPRCFIGWAMYFEGAHNITRLGECDAVKEFANKTLGLTDLEFYTVFHPCNSADQLHKMVKGLINGEDIVGQDWSAE